MYDLGKYDLLGYGVNQYPYNYPYQTETQPVQPQIQFGGNKRTAAAQKPSDWLEISAANETCTDGKNDGSIGFMEACGNAVKGAAKTAGSTVRGMFFDEEGFSWTRTLLTGIIGGTCILFPPAAAALGAAGLAIGGVQAASGIYDGLTAKTDAEAKEAWQRAGGGALTAGVSYFGAKSGIKAMKTSAAKVNGFSALDTLKADGGKYLSREGLTALKWDAQGSFQNGYGLVKQPAVLNAAKHPLQTAKTAAEGLLKKSTAAAKNAADDLEFVNLTGIDAVKTYNQGMTGLAGAAKTGAGAAAKAAGKNLQTILQYMKTYDYNAAVEKFGYASVHQALMASAGGLITAE